MSVSIRDFGKSTTGQTVKLAVLKNEFIEVQLLSYAAVIHRILVPDRKGNPVDVVLGYPTAADYELNTDSMGAAVGRFANRIAGAQFPLYEEIVHVTPNQNGNCLHSGLHGFNHTLFDVALTPGETDSVTMTAFSPAGTDGFPGNLELKIRYSLAKSGLVIRYTATTDAPTVCNMTNHSYFNLNGGGTAMAHTLALAAERYLETSPGCLPTGRALPVAGMPFDFRAAKAVGRDIDTAAEQLRLVNGYDHHFCVDGAGLRRAAVLRGDSSGIAMTMDTTSPGVQLYTANWLSRRGGKNGAVYEPRCAVCLEPQFPPDAVHHPGFPQPLLRRGECEMLFFGENVLGCRRFDESGSVLALVNRGEEAVECFGVTVPGRGYILE